MRAIEVGARLTVDSVEELAAAGPRGPAAAATTARVRLRLRPDMTDVATTSEFTEDEPLGAVADAYKPGIPHGGAAGGAARARPRRLDAGRECTPTWAGTPPTPSRSGCTPGGWAGWSASCTGRSGRLAAGGDRPRRRVLVSPAIPPGRGIRPELAAASPAEYAGGDRLPGSPRVWPAPGSTRPASRWRSSPGAGVYGSAGVHLSRVLNVKRQSVPMPRTWVGCDSSEVLLSDTTWEHSRWEPVPAQPVPGDADRGGRGRCQLRLRHDRPVDAAARRGGGRRPARLPRHRRVRGDAGRATSTRSRARPRCWYRADGAEVIRRAETLTDVLARERVPRSLRRRPRVLGVDHVAVAVADLDRSLEFYAGLLGLRVRDRGPAGSRPGRADDRSAGAEVEYADVELGGRTLELLQYRSSQPRGTAPARPERPGSLHIALEVEDAAAGARPPDRGRVRAAVGARSCWRRTAPTGPAAMVFYVRDPDGALLEIVQRPAVARRSVAGAAVSSYRP